MQLAKEHQEFFVAQLGESGCSVDPDMCKTYGVDWTKNYQPNASAVLFPKSTQDVSEILKYCNEYNIAIVPSGGRTGLAAGAVASNGEVVVSLEKMNRILNIDPVAMIAEVEAGVITQALQEAANEKGVFFALDLAAKGSCQIGGNIATNAGGLKFIKYGGMREQVLGLEVVLADGTIMDMNTSLRKNNTGYDLKELFIGSEGTLGVITAAKLKLSSKPKNLKLAMLAVSDFPKILDILKTINIKGHTLTAFEFFSDDALDIVCKAQNKTSPMSEKYPYYTLIEIEQEHDSLDEFEALLEALFENESIVDGVLATSQKEFHELWAFRELISESVTVDYHVYKNDISFAIEDLCAFMEKLKVVTSAVKNLKMVQFGHIGDGNIHLNYLGDKKTEFKDFMKEVKVLEASVFSLIKQLNGSISAEHGIGLLKKADLGVSRSELEIGFMKNIKKMFDPKNILNPGKIFD